MKNNEMEGTYCTEEVGEVHMRFLWGKLVKNRPPER
jgi:hypothetical protein